MWIIAADLHWSQLIVDAFERWSLILRLDQQEPVTSTHISNATNSSVVYTQPLEILSFKMKLKLGEIEKMLTWNRQEFPVLEGWRKGLLEVMPDS